MTIEAITFDFWDTIAVDDSDEPRRLASGLPSKLDARIQLFVDKITHQYDWISAARAAEAYGKANERFRHEWHSEHRTPSVSTRIFYAYEYLDLAPLPGQYAKLMREIEALVREIQAMEVRIPPDFAPGVHNALQLLSEEYQLGIISDTIHTQGRGIRHLLAQRGLLHYFKYCIFSDEIGASKPAAKLFRQAALGLQLPLPHIVHVGDRESNDIAGPLAVGMRAILFTGIVDRGSHQTRAHAICNHYQDLPQIVRQVAGGR